jgi:hypothetical protein
LEIALTKANPELLRVALTKGVNPANLRVALTEVYCAILEYNEEAHVVLLSSSLVPPLSHSYLSTFLASLLLFLFYVKHII